MKVLADLHHQSLFSSLVMLFEKRLGYEIFRPIGMEWFLEDYWRINNQFDTAEQYLRPGSIPADGTPPLNEAEDLKYGITLEDFKKTKFDILIASVPQHIDPFKELIDVYQPDAKLIYQVGNMWTVDATKVKNVMASALIPNIPSNINYVQYHQEFPLNVFYPSSFKPDKRIYSFVNCLNTADLFKEDWELFQALEKLLPAWDFKSFGGQCRDGNMNGYDELAAKMRGTAFGFHCKTGGDGYGHILHNLARSGVAPIIRKRDYANKLAEAFIEDGVTAITVDHKTPEQIAAQIEFMYNTPFLLKQIREELAKRFLLLVNFDEEEKEIQQFLENLI